MARWPTRTCPEHGSSSAVSSRAASSPASDQTTWAVVRSAHRGCATSGAVVAPTTWAQVSTRCLLRATPLPCRSPSTTTARAAGLSVAITGWGAGGGGPPAPGRSPRCCPVVVADEPGLAGGGVARGEGEGDAVGAARAAPGVRSRLDHQGLDPAAGLHVLAQLHGELHLDGADFEGERLSGGAGGGVGELVPHGGDGVGEFDAVEGVFVSGVHGFPRLSTPLNFTSLRPSVVVVAGPVPRAPADRCAQRGERCAEHGSGPAGKCGSGPAGKRGSGPVAVQPTGPLPYPASSYDSCPS